MLQKSVMCVSLYALRMRGVTCAFQGLQLKESLASDYIARQIVQLTGAITSQQNLVQ